MNDDGKNTFYISFETKTIPGQLMALRVDIRNELILDKDKKMNIALVDHPLYKDLERYVLSNPSGRLPTPPKKSHH